jgi:hypothetical protein
LQCPLICYNFLMDEMIPIEELEAELREAKEAKKTRKA